VAESLIVLALLVACGSPDTPEFGAVEERDTDDDRDLEEATTFGADPVPYGSASETGESRPDNQAFVPDEPKPASDPGFLFRAGVNEIVVSQVVDDVVVARRALIVVPQDDLAAKDRDITGASFPVLVALHGNGGRPEGMLGDIRPIVERYRFVAVIPAGIERSWNLGREASTADDVAFVELLLDQLDGARTDVGDFTLERVYAFGYSNGAGLVNQLVARTDRFHAVAAAASSLTHELVPTGTVAPVSFLSLHGTEDRVAPYGGGVGVAGHDFLAVEDSAALWADRFGCETEPDTTPTADGNIRLEWRSCEDGHRVVHYGFVGVEHGLPPDLEGGLLDLVIDFFETASHSAG
jgi:poly(3-hydroxybutyrate) depolymerase